MTFVSLPFHIQRIGTTDPAVTLRWTGWILGITSLVTVAAVTLIVLGGSIQVFFFTAIVPHALTGFGVDAARTLEVGGMLIFVSGVAAALGAVAVPRLGELFPERRLIGALLVTSSVCLAAFATASSVWLYGGLRFLQVLSIALVFPLVVARLTQHAGGAAIGLACVPLLTMREAGARA